MTAIHCSQLSFDLQLTTEDYAPENFSVPDASGAEPSETLEGEGVGAAIALPTVLVRALVDGVEPLMSRLGRPFDPIEALLYGAEPGDHDFYTCSCGVAGCAGLHEGVTVALGESQVTWSFPLSTYADKLNSAFTALEGTTGGARVVTFDKQQYLQALETLESQLHSLAAKNPHMQVAPCDSHGDPRDNAFEVIWPRCQKSAEKERCIRAMTREVFGDMAELNLLLSTPFGLFRLWPGGLRRVICPDYEWDEDLEAARPAFMAAVSSMRSTRGDPMLFVREFLDWDVLRDHACHMPGVLGADGDYEDIELPKEPSAEFLAAMTATWGLDASQPV